MLFKCKMCGGELDIDNKKGIGECPYCDTVQTLPRLTNDKKSNLYDRANHFRLNNEYDKAMSIYEEILNEDREDAESYWSIILCRYGIEYVDDPITHKKVPTVNRTQFTSVYSDEDYKAALRFADAEQKEVYEKEAKAIDEIQKGILVISQAEEPFDIFICYKETDKNGRRTPDSVLANDIYYQLVNEGYKVFFSRITLEDKLGTAYEPYIFAALNSAKIMIVVGTKPEYFNAAWVKNEWSRYLSLIRNGAEKILIPAYRDMDPYDLPDAFSHLQAQDMSKLGFMQDLVRGVKKIFLVNDNEISEKINDTRIYQKNNSAIALMKRGYLALEDAEWKRADEFFEQSLNMNPENGEAYFGKFLAEQNLSNQKQFAKSRIDLYKDCKTKICYACDRDISLEESCVNKNVVPDYLSEETIRALFEFDLSFPSNLSSRKEQYASERTFWVNNKTLSKAFRFANSDFAEELNGIRESIFQFLQIKIDEAEIKDKNNIDKLRTLYKNHLVEAEKKANKLGYDAKEKKASDLVALDEKYKAAFRMLQKAKKEADYKNVAKLFEDIDFYLDSKEKAQYCQDKADRKRSYTKTLIIVFVLFALIVILSVTEGIH